VTRGQLPQRAGSLGLTAVGLQPRYPQNLSPAAEEANSRRDYQHIYSQNDTDNQHVVYKMNYTQ